MRQKYSGAGRVKPSAKSFIANGLFSPVMLLHRFQL